MSEQEEIQQGEPGEIVVGLVAPVGCDFDKLVRSIEGCLDDYNYKVELYRLTDFFRDDRVRLLAGSVADDSEYERIRTSMDVGDQLRIKTLLDGILAIYAATEVAQKRPRDADGSPKPLPRTAHVLRSLKRPEEVVTLRRMYGSRFILISAYVPRETRISNLSHKMKEEQAVALVKRDEEGGDHGQATAETFQLADLFVDATATEQTLVNDLQRFFDLLFGCPFVTPTKDEHAMFLAFAASLRSGDLSRQVGAVVTTEDGTVIGEGANDAPRFGGGQYWPGVEDQRDIVLGYDSNEEAKRETARAILKACQVEQPDGVDPLTFAKKLLSESGVFDVTEYGRAVHAEMAALLSCSRSGVPTKGGTLFCTTFPCHNCAKHIVAAGIKQVRFIEPYAKSKALILHGDAISMKNERDRVNFSPFVGIGPRRYVELFSLKDAFGFPVKRKDVAGHKIRWERKSSMPVVPDHLLSYLDREEWALPDINEALSTAENSTPN